MDYFWVAHVVTHFMAPHKQKKYKKKRKRENTKKSKKYWKKIKKYISKKSIPEHPGNYRMLVEKDQIYKFKKFDSVFLTDCDFISK
jgi:hypothetical protein